MLEISFMDIASAVFFIALTAFGYQWGSTFLYPLSKAKEYVNWYKVGRVKQYATEHGINIDEVVAYEEIRQQKKIVRTWTEKIEAELSKDLAPIEELKEKKEEKKK